MRIFSLFLLLIFSTRSIFGKDEYKLMFSQVLFRHGARAPSELLTDPEYEKSFPRGLGEMTDRGFENSHLLGLFLRNRYVNKKFLNPDLKPSEMYWRSVNKNRCLSTASTVGYAMFDDGNDRHLHVAVATEEEGENLLNYNQDNCAQEYNLVNQTCPGFSGIYHPWPRYEAYIARCLNYSHPVFNDYPFHTIEAYINQYKNGLPLPKLIEQHIDEIMSIYVNVTQFITGTGRHHNPPMMRVKFGFLIKTLMKNLAEERGFYEADGKVKKKFKAYSTQDWILMGVLDSLGVLEETVGMEVYPEYNSMIIMELYRNRNKKKREYFVKTFYKREEITAENHQLIDVSHLVRGCPRDQPYCPFNDFLNCCNEYMMDENEGCDVDTTEESTTKKTQTKRSLKRKIILAGPE